MLILLVVLGVFLFWQLPLKEALYIFVPIAVVFLGVNLAINRQISKAMKLPVLTGSEGMVGKTAEVILVPKVFSKTGYMVRYESELWGARCDAALRIGERVKVSALDVIMLIVEPIEKRECDLSVVNS